MEEMIEKPCEYCGNPMFVAKGKMVPYINKYGEPKVRVNPDQEARYHGICRRPGREAERARMGNS